MEKATKTPVSYTHLDVYKRQPLYRMQKSNFKYFKAGDSRAGKGRGFALRKRKACTFDF